MTKSLIENKKIIGKSSIENKKNIIMKKSWIDKKIKKEIITKNLYSKLLGNIIKKGKKNLAKKALTNSLYIASKLYKISTYNIISKIFSRIRCHAEIRKVTKRKMTTLIPFPVKKSRQDYLKVKWFLHGTKENKNKMNFSYKLFQEFEKNFQKPLYIRTQRTIINNLLIKNIANAHFRWVKNPKKPKTA